MYVLDFLNLAAGDFCYLIIALCELLFVAWVYGPNNFMRDLERMTGPKPYWFKYLFIAVIGIICPIIIFVSVEIFVLEFFITFFLCCIQKAFIIIEIVEFEDHLFPWYVELVYWLISVVPLIFLIFFAAYELKKVKRQKGFIDWVIEFYIMQTVSIVAT